jgi:site-specific DNA-methyltransferase (adenine-specific)
MELNKIYNEDCIQGMERLPSGSIDLIVTSPPYFLKKSYEKSWSWEKFDQLIKSVLVQSERLLKPGGYMVLNFGDNGFSRNNLGTECIGTYPMSHYYWENKGQLELQATRIWRKQFSRVPFNGQAKNAPRNLFDYEHIWTFRKRDGKGKEKVRDIKKSCRGVLGDDWKASAGLKRHPAAFPIDLPLWAIEVYSDAGSIVLDPFMGSGTTALAAARLGRDYIGYELDANYVALAESRLLEEQDNGA